MNLSETDRQLLAQAVELAFLCPPDPAAFAVGCVIADRTGAIIAAGYSREDGPHRHAEEIALARARQSAISLTDATLYTSLEPCSFRLSGKTPCCAHILASGIARVVFAAREPPVFVDCTGFETLQAAGIEVSEDATLRARVAAANPGFF